MRKLCAQPLSWHTNASRTHYLCDRRIIASFIRNAMRFNNELVQKNNNLFMVAHSEWVSVQQTHSNRDERWEWWPHESGRNPFCFVITRVKHASCSFWLNKGTRKCSMSGHCARRAVRVLSVKWKLIIELEERVSAEKWFELRSHSGANVPVAIENAIREHLSHPGELNELRRFAKLCQIAVASFMSLKWKHSETLHNVCASQTAHG